MFTFTMTQKDGFGDWRQHSYTCPDDGGYIYFGDCIGGHQVCEGLERTGNTLRCSSAKDLPRVIRRERRRQLRRQRQDARMNRWYRGQG